MKKLIWASMKSVFGTHWPWIGLSLNFAASAAFYAHYHLGYSEVYGNWAVFYFCLYTIFNCVTAAIVMPLLYAAVVLASKARGMVNETENSKFNVHVHVEGMDDDELEAKKNKMLYSCNKFIGDMHAKMLQDKTSLIAQARKGIDIILDVTIFLLLVTYGFYVLGSFHGIAVFFQHWMKNKSEKRISNYAENNLSIQINPDEIDELSDKLFNG